MFAVLNCHYCMEVKKPLERDIVKFVSSKYIVGKKRLPGAGGKELWAFKAVGAGKTNIYFKYVRPWEKDMPPAEKETFIVTVKE